ncbi:TetR/AcrR family transcriptional regulator [Hyphomonas johnsonii]|jgi:AcrR family transcriptional regulator|uniref:TetR family transcriptional regulator n=1 Tax=Hyphomonas johnsonii MHS-2 TaxID=1280950 RepID=A0A059FUG4_9PROT|nr:TetR/AcrR family transcriptional regulator [Hyphomonas johnsonii]KCZ94141.1 TetR family transcriptional regulator [Hyphomonas johnsonii MHS-2]
MPSDMSLEQTPAERRRSKVRGAIIDAAERVFASEGENGLSIRRLAEEIDYSPSAIYKYFGSKEELIDELKEAFFKRLLSRVDMISGTDRPFHLRARACVSTYIETAVERPHHYAAAFSNAYGSNTGNVWPDMDWETFMQTNKGRAFGLLVDMVREGQSLGVFDPSLDPYLSAKSVWAASHGLAQLMTHLPQFPDLRPTNTCLSASEFVAFHADLVFRGLQHPAVLPHTDPTAQD